MNIEVFEYQPLPNTSLEGELQRCSWRDVSSGKPRTLTQANALLPTGCIWTTNWKYECSDPDSDNEGWSLQWVDISTGAVGSANGENVLQLRRRRWVRGYEQATPQAPVQPPITVGQMDTKTLLLLQQLELLKRTVGTKLQQLGGQTNEIDRMAKLLQHGSCEVQVVNALSSKVAQGKSALAAAKTDLAKLDVTVNELGSLASKQKVEQGAAGKQISSVPSTPILNSVRNKLNKDCKKLEMELTRVCKIAMTAQRNARKSQVVQTASTSGAWETSGTPSSGSFTVQQHENTTTAISGNSIGWSFPSPDAKGTSAEKADLDQVPAVTLTQRHTEEINAEIMREREQALGKIAANMQEVQAVMGDLAALTHEQEAGINKVADIVDKTHEQTERGLAELKKADAAQQKGGSCVIS